MTGAMYAAIAGLKTHMQKLNVIGNNVANVNTQGYKSQRAIFKDAMYTMYSSGSNGTEVKGGQNPSQIGYGSQISSIDLNMRPGSFAPGNALDCMIDGDGFFLVGDKNLATDGVIDPNNPNSFKSFSLTRVGDFKFGPDGYLVDGSGSVVYGFMAIGTNADGSPIMSDQLVPIRLPKMEKVPVNIQTGAELTTPGDADKEGKAEDPDGWKYMMKPRFPVGAVDANGKPATNAQLQAAVDASKQNPGTPPADLKPTQLKDYVGKDANGNDVDLPFANIDGISIDKNSGRISGTMKDTGEWVTLGFLAIGNVTNNEGLTHEGGFYYKCGDGAGDLSVSMLGGAEKSLYTPGGKMETVNGSLAGQAGEWPTADEKKALSDKALISSAGKTKLNPGGLEGSNTDLATEISEMITTQRGYQANTRIITVTDSMLEELVNMKR